MHIFLGNSASGSDYCLWTEIYLFGYIVPQNVIFYDDMSNIASTGWIIPNSGSVDQESSATRCSKDSCVEIRGFADEDNSISKSIQSINEYFDIFIKYDVYFRDMESTNECQLFYKYNTDNDWLLWQSFAGGEGDYSQKQIIVSLLDHPQLNTQVTRLDIKFATNGNSNNGNDFCYFDEVYVKGTKADASNTAIMQQKIQKIQDARAKTENIYIIGDWGGQHTFPYTTPQQLAAAEMMNTVAKMHDIHGIIALGDNFYDEGVENEFDTRWQATFENVYVKEYINDIKWWPVVGNHDAEGNITGQIEYTKHSQTWNFPAFYYTKSWFFGSNDEIELKFIALDTHILCGFPAAGNYDCIPPDQADADEHFVWLEDVLKANTATFTLVGGHISIHSFSSAGPTAQFSSSGYPFSVSNACCFVFAD